MTDPVPDPALARADLCRFLSACFYEPGPEFSEERMFESMELAAAPFGAGLVDAVRRLADAFGAESPDDLKVDYARVFLGPVAAPARPYGSVWLEPDAGLMQASTMAVLELYREAGFDLADDFRELPDHIAVELEFLYVLTFRQAQAREAGDVQQQARFESLARRLLETHLARWVEPFTDALSRSASTRFYRELADVTRRVVAAQWSAIGAPGARH
jgi:TorA maturation chaperone TorD